jgi:beta-glucosidase/6-phospho-beta-glucosidase/beta-galactosidase/ABC-type amino acid transport substrate-binding protein
MQRDLRFGVATADHQCEAYSGQDDIRDVWERVRGLTARGRATDFWNRYREDVDLARSLGCRAFRISLAWARLEPEPGKWDDEAFEHYRDVLQYMRDAGMATVVSLHHNTWPLHVQAAGNGAGMLDADFPARMEAYASQIAQRLGDWIDYYVTLNEPNQLVYGYIKGFWMRAYAVPPGLEPFATSDEQMDAVLRLIPNLFRAHARARQAIHAVKPTARVGANPLILGLPRWLQSWVDRNATHLKTPQQAHRQAARLSQVSVLDSGSVDITIAQLTMTQARAEHVLFSEPYYVAHLAALRPASLAIPVKLDTWQIRIGVTSGVPAAAQAVGLFPAAAIEYYSSVVDAVDALRKGAIDFVFDDDVVLKQYATDGFTLTQLPGNDQNFAVAMAFGSRALLNAVDRALRDYKLRDPSLPRGHNRKTIAHIGKAASAGDSAEGAVPDLDKSLQVIRKRGVLRVGVHPGVNGLCVTNGSGNYTGLEPDLARHIARFVLGGDDPKVAFVPLSGQRRLSATRSWLQLFDGLRKSIAMFGTLLGTNWWNLGMAGKLPHFLCPPESVGALDYVGLDYYWGVPSVWPSQLQRLAAAADFHYANAPVWPNVLDQILREAQAQFPGKPIVVIENGCVTSADGFSRAEYLSAHIAQVERALQRGAPIEAYLCWSVTSNREWGLPFNDGSDFGLYYIDLDRDANLTRTPTEASARYAKIIADAESS